MSKIAEYLSQHIVGEITSNKAIRQRYSHDASVLSQTPELVLFPRVTNDIRKAARFAWQLAEKGHVLGLTMRGGGSDQTGAAIGKGMIISTTAYLNSILHIAAKNKFVHVQPGVTFGTLNAALEWQGLRVAAIPESAAYATVGGSVANGAGGAYGWTGSALSRLEVVLSNGDLMEVSRISKHELNKRKGLQTFEGELYRKLEGLIEDNLATIDKLALITAPDNTGYRGITQVRAKDGSFDLTPLFVGSQGTLGILSELVLNVEFIGRERTALVAVFGTLDAAHDAAEALTGLQPHILETYDGEFFGMASDNGKQFAAFHDINDMSEIGGVVYVQFDDFSDHHREHKLKKALKIISKLSPTLSVTSEDYPPEELQAIREVTATLLANTSLPPLGDGAYLPAEHYDAFHRELVALAAKHHVSLPIKADWHNQTLTVRAPLELDSVSNKQKFFKLLSEYAALVIAHGGSFTAQSAEGRIKTIAAYAGLDDDVKELYAQVKAAFDPYGILNPGVKQPTELTQLAGALRSSYDLSDFADHAPHI